MITKGIIKSIDLLGNTCTVHLPFFETAGNDPIIETATVSNTPGSYNGYKVGDVVYIAFEDGNMDTPVVIGKLYLGTEKEKADPRGVSNVEESTTTKKATLPADAKLTAEIDSSVPNTTVPYSSLSSIANGLNTLNTNVVQMDRDYGNRFKQVISNADGLKSELEQTAENMMAKVSGCELDAEGNPIRQEQFGWSLQKGSWTVFNKNKTILTADGNGLHVAGQVDAESGHIGNFMIGNSGISSSTSDDGKETAWSSSYTDTPKTDTGVYVGPDGIKLGKNFSVDPSGKITANEGKIAKYDINGNKLISGAVGMSSDTNSGAYSFWAGNAIPSSAPFSVTNTGNLKATSGEIAGLQIVTTSANAFNDSETKTITILTGYIRANTYIDIDIIAKIKELDSTITDNQQIIVTSIYLENGLHGSQRFTTFEIYKYNPMMCTFAYHNLSGSSGASDKQQGNIVVSYFSRSKTKENNYSYELISLDKNFKCKSNPLQGSSITLDNLKYATNKGNFLYSAEGAFGPLQFKNGQIVCNETAIQFIQSKHNGQHKFIATITTQSDEIFRSIITVKIERHKDYWSTHTGLWYDYTFPIRYQTVELEDTFLYDTITIKKGATFGILNVDNQYTVTKAELIDWYTGAATTSFTFEAKAPYEGDPNVKVWPDTQDFNNSIIIKNANLIPQSDFMNRAYISGEWFDYSPYSLGSDPEPWGTIYAVDINARRKITAGSITADSFKTSAGVELTSDRKLKNTIEYDISRYDRVFDNLKPVSYKYNNSTSNRTHLGFIAQDVEEAIIKSNLTTNEYAILTIEGDGFDPDKDIVTDEEKTIYRLRYDELHALEVRQIQLLKTKVKQQETTIIELTKRLEKLENKN